MKSNDTAVLGTKARQCREGPGDEYRLLYSWTESTFDMGRLQWDDQRFLFSGSNTVTKPQPTTKQAILSALSAEQCANCDPARVWRRMLALKQAYECGNSATTTLAPDPSTQTHPKLVTMSESCMSISLEATRLVNSMPVRA